MRAAQPFLPPQPRPAPEDPGQFSFGDRVRVERILGEAGFAGLRIEPIDRPIWSVSVDMFAPNLISSALAAPRKSATAAWASSTMASLAALVSKAPPALALAST